MLPPTVAIALQQKKQVTAETYESVTVYFRLQFISSFNLEGKIWLTKILVGQKFFLRIHLSSQPY